LLLKIGFVAKSEAGKKGMKDSTARISNSESCAASKKFYSRNVLCAFGRLSPACRKKNWIAKNVRR